MATLVRERTGGSRVRRTPRTTRATAQERGATIAPERGGFAHVSRMALVGLILLAVALLGLFQVLQTSHVASTGFELRQLQSERATLESEIRLLEASIAEQSQLERIREEATGRLGMVEPETTLRVDVETRAPSEVPLPRRYVEEPEAAEVDEPAWWEPLLERLPGFD